MQLSVGGSWEGRGGTGRRGEALGGEGRHWEERGGTGRRGEALGGEGRYCETRGGNDISRGRILGEEGRYWERRGGTGRGDKDSSQWEDPARGGEVDAALSGRILLAFPVLLQSSINYTILHQVSACHHPEEHQVGKLTSPKRTFAVGRKVRRST